MPVINSSPPFTFGPDPFRIVEEPMFGSSSNQYACQVCLDTATPGESVKFHRHHSSFFYKKWHLEQGLKELKCPTCKIVHPIEPDVERKVVFMTSSTLHNVFLDPAVRLPFHLDIESICGARLTDMIRAWRRTYGRAEVACDTIVLAGLLHHTNGMEA